MFRLLFYSPRIGKHTTEGVSDVTPNHLYRKSPATNAFLKGDEHQLLVSKSPIVADDHPWLDPVTAHVARDGLLAHGGRRPLAADVVA
jgi:hypothetical protein